MKFDLEDFHVIHVLAAYAAAGLGMLGLAVFTVCDYLKSRRNSP